MPDAAVELDQQFREALTAWDSAQNARLPTVDHFSPELTARDALELFESQVISRHLDLAARRLGTQRRGFYSIGSSGHEGNAAVAFALRDTDPVLPHYRSGALFAQRTRRIADLDPIRDVLLGVVAAAGDPISGGRHKVFGSKAAHIIPQTSTIASQLPRAVGLAFGIDRAQLIGVRTEWPPDAVVLCSFGDASANHSTAVGAVNAALHTAAQGVGMPILFLCEDNGIGISVPTPHGWIEQAYGNRSGLRYFDADGSDLRDAAATALDAVSWVRQRRRPAFLRLRTVRLLGHAGSDVESAYRPAAAIAADLARDPVLATARLLITTGVATPHTLRQRYDSIARRVSETAESVVREATLRTADQVMAPIPPAVIPGDAENSGRNPGTGPDSSTSTGHAAPNAPTAPTNSPPDANLVGHDGAPATALPAVSGTATEHTVSTLTASPEIESDAPPTRSATRTQSMTLAQAINHTLAQLLAEGPEVLVFGEDVGRKGGVYGVTKGLRKQFGARRVFDTLLDEQSVLGTALGCALAGFVPIPEIQYLAYLHNAADQLRGEAATLSFFSTGQYRNPMVVRIAGLAYQKGFGGHFHNDNSVAALRDIPGIVLAAPARADDASAMLRACVASARSEGRVCVFLEPIALYHTRDLYRTGDEGWSAAPDTVTNVDGARCYGSGTDLVIVTFANGVPMSLRAAQRLSDDEINARVLDLRWLAPLPVDDLLLHARECGRVLVADETRGSGGVAESVITALVDAGFAGQIMRVNSADSFVPLGPAAATVLLNEADIEDAARQLLARGYRTGTRRYR